MRRALIAGLFLLAALPALLSVCALPAHAQFIGYSSPQTAVQTLANATACTGAAQNFNVQNLGQNQHFASISTSGVANLKMQIQGVDSNGTAFSMSDDLILAGTNSTGSLYGSGWYPIIRVQVTCDPAGGAGTFTLSYNGTSANGPMILGNYQISQQDKFIWNTVNAAAAHSLTFQTPFGTSEGTISAVFAVVGPNVPVISVTCTSQFGPYTQAIGFFVTAITMNPQSAIFKVPPFNCPNMTVAFAPGGAAAGTVTVEYFFSMPGTENKAISTYFHYGNNTTAAVVKAASGSVTTLTVGTPANGTVTLHDLPNTSCVAVPATGIVGVFTIIAATPPASYPLNLYFKDGICIKASAGAMDITVGFQ